MAERSVNWRLSPEHAAQTQGLVVSGFGHLPYGRALLLHHEGEGNGWVRKIAEIAPPTPADGKRLKRGSAIAFTHSGLQAMGITAAGPPAAPDPFVEGMFETNRSRRLNDRRDGEWNGAVVPEGPHWSGNPGGAEQTPHTVHALLVLYAETEPDADAWTGEVEAALAPCGVSIVKTLPMELRPDEKGIFREHFGFADGISQPIPYDATPNRTSSTVIGDDGEAFPEDPAHGVPLGEILFGHWNGHHEYAPGPALNGDTSLALNGTYMAVREYKQDVAAFWKSMEAGAAGILAADPDADATAENLAERVIGRTVDGAMLGPDGPLGQDDNDFMYFDRDPNGIGCPLGSHVRRGNPRDGLATKPEQKKTLLEAANRHRILRRARKFGRGLPRGAPDDGEDRGLFFMALNTDIQRQFEFVIQTWIMNPDFSTLYDEVDPLLGPGGPMSMRDRPLRRIVDVHTYVRLVGGEYFFVPSLPAFEWIAKQ